MEISFDESIETTKKTEAVNIVVSDSPLGVYKYEVTETGNKDTAGVTYSNEKFYLVLTVLRDENSSKHYVAAMHYEDENGKKVNEDNRVTFTNIYDAGTLNVTKKITGNMADMDKKFKFTVVFKAVDKKIKSRIGLRFNGNDATEVETLTEADGVYTVTETSEPSTFTYEFYLGHDDTFTFTNVPATVSYTINEDKENYTEAEVVVDEDMNKVTEETGDTAVTTVSGTIEVAQIGKEDETITPDIDSVTYTNQLGTAVDTGISLDSMPYLMVLALAALGLFGFVSKKRYNEF